MRSLRRATRQGRLEGLYPAFAFLVPLPYHSTPLDLRPPAAQQEGGYDRDSRVTEPEHDRFPAPTTTTPCPRYRRTSTSQRHCVEQVEPVLSGSGRDLSEHGFGLGKPQTSIRTSPRRPSTFVEGPQVRPRRARSGTPRFRPQGTDTRDTDGGPVVRADDARPVAAGVLGVARRLRALPPRRPPLRAGA